MTDTAKPPIDNLELAKLLAVLGEPNRLFFAK